MQGTKRDVVPSGEDILAVRKSRHAAQAQQSDLQVTGALGGEWINIILMNWKMKITNLN